MFWRFVTFLLVWSHLLCGNMLARFVTFLLVRGLFLFGNMFGRYVMFLLVWSEIFQFVICFGILILGAELKLHHIVVAFQQKHCQDNLI